MRQLLSLNELKNLEEPMYYEDMLADDRDPLLSSDDSLLFDSEEEMDEEEELASN